MGSTERKAARREFQAWLAAENAKHAANLLVLKSKHTSEIEEAKRLHRERVRVRREKLRRPPAAPKKAGSTAATPAAPKPKRRRAPRKVPSERPAPTPAAPKPKPKPKKKRRRRTERVSSARARRGVARADLPRSLWGGTGYTLHKIPGTTKVRAVAVQYKSGGHSAWIAPVNANGIPTNMGVPVSTPTGASRAQVVAMARAHWARNNRAK